MVLMMAGLGPSKVPLFIYRVIRLAILFFGLTLGLTNFMFVVIKNSKITNECGGKERDLCKVPILL